MVTDADNNNDANEDKYKEITVLMSIMIRICSWAVGLYNCCFCLFVCFLSSPDFNQHSDDIDVISERSSNQGDHHDHGGFWDFQSSCILGVAYGVMASTSAFLASVPPELECGFESQFGVKFPVISNGIF